MLTRDIFCKLSCNVRGMSGSTRNELSTKKGVTKLTYQEVYKIDEEFVAYRIVIVGLSMYVVIPGLCLWNKTGTGRSGLIGKKRA